MKKTENILINAGIACNAMLLMLLLFETRVAIPGWLQIGGRLHPMILHFPIALAVMLALFVLYKTLRKQVPDPSLKTWLLLAAFITGCTALSGFFLSKETGYDAAAIAPHKWSGVFLSGLLLLWSLFYESIKKSRLVTGMAALASLAAVMIAGEWGAGITHGENYLWAPLWKADEKPTVLFEDALVYRDMVNPVLEAKCMNCHNENKAKGELAMTTEELLIKGGKNGRIWDLKEPGFGLMMKRLHLPLQNKKHMPPAGKPQLTDEEIFIIEQWLVKGASFTQKITSFSTEDTLYKLASAMFSTLATETYDFDEADAGTIRKLNTSNRSVYLLAAEVPAIAVDFFGRSQYKPEQLKDLLEIKEQIVSLNLNKMPLEDEDMDIITQFKNLRKLNLSFTQITGKGLDALQPLQHLKQLSVSGTAITKKDFEKLKHLKALTNLYAWSTIVKPDEQIQLNKSFGNKRIEWGFYGDTLAMQLNAPVIENEAQILTEPTELKLKHFLAGVTIHYSLDGSDPDSLQSPVYKPGIMINSQALLKAKAFKQGWLSSNVAQLNFYKNKYKPDSVWALLPADEAYKGNGPATLNDNIKGDNNFRSGKWLGYRFNAMDLMLRFNKPTPVSSITLSSLVDIASYIMPPQSVEVWGGTGMANMKLLKRIQPVQPLKEVPFYMEGFECRFNPETITFIRILARPIGILPPWHRGKGDKAWIFTDEIFVN